MPGNKSRERCRAVHETFQDTEETEVSARDFDVVRSKTFNLNSVRLSIFLRLNKNTNSKKYVNTK